MKVGDKVVAISKSFGMSTYSSKLLFEKIEKPIYITELVDTNVIYCCETLQPDINGEVFLINDLITLQEYIKQMRNKKLKRILNGKNTDSI